MRCSAGCSTGRGGRRRAATARACGSSSCATSPNAASSRSGTGRPGRPTPTRSRAALERSGAPTTILDNAQHFADHLEDVPVLIVVCAQWDAIYPTDHQLGRISVVGGCSIYPGVQNLLLKARDEGLGTALTTLLCRYEPQVKALLEIPDGVITAAHIALGWPARPLPKKLSRRPLDEMAFLDTYGHPLR